MFFLFSFRFAVLCWVILFQQEILDGKYDDLSEQAFYMVGGIDEVIAKGEKIAKEAMEDAARKAAHEDSKKAAESS